MSDPPDPHHGPRKKVSSDLIVDDPGSQLTSASDTSHSNIVTLEPFSLSKGNIKSKGKRKRDFVVNRSGPCFERLPGLFESNSYDKFLVLSALNGKKVEDLNVFEVHRDIVSCLGRDPKIISQSTGDLLIEVASPEESEKLQRLAAVNGVAASCLPHTSLNNCKGVVYCKELLRYSEEMLLEELRDQHVIEVKRMKKKIGDFLEDQPMLILTFK